MDTFIYNGDIERGTDLDFIQLVAENKNSERCNLVLVTPGGDPDAAFKMARYMQTRYKHFQVTVPGYCKSAGTLLAIGAHQLVFAPYGELGPLDIQLSKVDKIAGLESGLNINEAFNALETRSRKAYQNIVGDILRSSAGVVSFHTASHSAAELVAALYSPIFSQIDPEEVGSRTRAMRIGEDYGTRLNVVSQNLKDRALKLLSQSYSSHGFVIDFLEACSLFHNVRMATADEMKAIEDLGPAARLPQRSGTSFDRIDWPDEGQDEGKEKVHVAQHRKKPRARANPKGNGSDTAGAIGG